MLFIEFHKKACLIIFKICFFLCYCCYCCCCCYFLLNKTEMFYDNGKQNAFGCMAFERLKIGYHWCRFPNEELSRSLELFFFQCVLSSFFLSIFFFSSFFLSHTLLLNGQSYTKNFSMHWISLRYLLSFAKSITLNGVKFPPKMK